MPTTDGFGTQPEDQWWCINGAELMAALQRVADGDGPGVAYLELLANCTTDEC